MKDIKILLQRNVENLANVCLINTGVYHVYKDKDLVNATLVFVHFFMDSIFTANKHLPLDKQKELVTTVGEAIRELIKTSTGKDMHILTKNYEN